MARREQNLALAEAQNLMWTAFETPSKVKRVELAKLALSISPDCADAYVVLADETARTSQKRIEILEEGVKAGERALGPTYFKEDVGSFWGILETRPYMRARFGLAVELKIAGRMDEALIHFQEVLRLNGHSDNQGVRYILAPYFLSVGRIKEAEKLIKEYADDVGPELNYTHALLLFKQKGDSEKAREVLQEAARRNPSVISYLLTPKLSRRLTPAPGTAYSDKEEAYVYAHAWRKSWLETKGSLDWLVQNLLTGWIAKHNLYISDKKILDLTM